MVEEELSLEDGETTWADTTKSELHGVSHSALSHSSSLSSHDVIDCRMMSLAVSFSAFASLSQFLPWVILKASRPMNPRPF